MELMEAILTRRSVRQYSDKKVEAEVIREIVKAGMYAPSARNQQAWEFIIITDKDILNKIGDAMENARPAKNATFAVLICGNPKRFTSPEYFPQDGAASIQNMMLAAFGKGIGTVWIGTCPKEDRMQKFRDICSIPADIIPHSLMVGGYMKDAPAKAERFHEEYIHTNIW